jgi:hypothetical protein
MLAPDVVAARNARRRWSGVVHSPRLSGAIRQAVEGRKSRSSWSCGWLGGFADALNTHPMP